MQNKTIKPTNGKSVVVDMSPLTIVTPSNQNQHPCLSLNGIYCRPISSASMIYISGTTTDAVTETNPSAPPPPLNNDYTFFTNFLH